jgi:signal transduction histidine kinase
MLLRFHSCIMTAGVEGRNGMVDPATHADTIDPADDTGLELHAQPGVPEQLLSIVQRAVSLIGLNLGGLYLLAPDGETLILSACVGPAPQQGVGASLRIGEGLAGKVLRTRRPLWVQDYEHWPEKAELFENSVIRRALSVPISTGDRILGVLTVDSDSDSSPFSDAEIQLVCAFADQAAIALENAQLLSTSQRQTRELMVLHEVAMAISSLRQTDEVLRAVYDQVAGLFPFESFVVATCRDDAAEFKIALCVHDGQPTPDFDGQIFPVAAGGLTGWVLSQRLPLLIRDLAVDDLPVQPRILDDPTRSWLGVPLTVRGKVIGAMSVQSREPDAFHEPEKRLMVSLASQVAIALDNAHLYAAQAHRTAELEAIRQASLRLTSSLDLQPVLNAILETALHLVAADDAHIFLYDAKKDKLTFGTALWMSERRTEPFSEPRRDGLTYAVARSGKRIAISDADQNPLFKDWKWGGAILGLPLRFNDQVRGVMNVALWHPHVFNDDELRVLDLLADQAAVVLENARLYGEIRHHADELEARVTERTEELQKANESLRTAATKLEELDRLKSQFVSNVSHELRTPLTNIKLYLSLLENGKPEKHDQYMCTLSRETNLLQHLIEDLLDLSHLDLGRIRPLFEWLDTGDLIRTLVDDRTPLINRGHLTITTSQEPSLPPAFADRKMMLQVLTNLITNATNYTPAGGQIAVSTTLESVQGKSWNVICVSDSGPGIDPEESALIFQRFYRGSSARRSGISGTGLGLAISQEIMHLHRGKITVGRAVEGGARFSVWLPRPEEPSSPASGTGSEPAENSPSPVDGTTQGRA